MNIAIAIDGPAGAGKSTIAKMLSKRFNLMYINTGAMYRAVTYFALKENIKPEECDKLCSLIEKLNMYFVDDKLYVNDEEIEEYIYMPVISNNVSAYASIKEVREKLVQMQKKIAEKYSVIMDGRDIGTVVLKNADIKFFLTASPEERAKRRYKELLEKKLDVQYDNILNDIVKRDYIDSHREVNPLTKAEDAIIIDSSNLNLLQTVDQMSSYISKVIPDFNITSCK